jgi:DNA-binding NtrC family response regulator
MLGSDERKRILVVDDERVITDTLVAIFLKGGYDARGVYSAEQALALIPEWRPALAIIDVRLPQMNGIDLAIALKARFPDCRLSLFSGQAATSDLLEMAKQNGHSFEVFPKPVHPTMFLGLAAELVQPAAESSLDLN